MLSVDIKGVRVFETECLGYAAPQDSRQLQTCIRSRDGGAVRISPGVSVFNAMVYGVVGRRERRFICRSETESNGCVASWYFCIIDVGSPTFRPCSLSGPVDV